MCAASLEMNTQAVKTLKAKSPKAKPLTASMPHRLSFVSLLRIPDRWAVVDAMLMWCDMEVEGWRGVATLKHVSMMY